MINISVEQDWNQEQTTYWVELDETTIGVADTNGDVDLVRKDHEGDAVLVRYHEDTWYTEALEALLGTLDRDDENQNRLHSLVDQWLWDQSKARA
jgi:hypothetical protein